MKPRMIQTFSRRKFLISSGWLAVGTTVVFQSGCSLPTLPTISDDPYEDAQGWIQVQPDNRVRFYMGKAEMGQGILTALTQLVAEELNLQPEQILAILPTTQEVNAVKMTVGSESIQDLYLPVRRATALLRETLRELAAKNAEVTVDQLTLTKGGFRVDASEAFFSFGDIVKKQDELKIVDSTKVNLKLGPESAIGKSVPRLDIPDKVSGKTLYSHDVVLPEMLFGVVMHPPAFGAYLKSAETLEAEKQSGVVKVIVSLDNNFVGVVAISDSLARNALGKIKAKWEIPKLWQQSDIDNILDLERLKSKGISPHLVLDKGDVEENYKQAHQQVAFSFSTPFGAHAQMETHAAVAHVTKNSAELWVGSQDQFYQQDLTADITGLPKDKVTVYPIMLGGGFGGKVVVEAAMEAVRLSQAVQRPVKVVWNREENLRHTYFRPPTRHIVRAGLNKEGRVSSWHHELSSGLVIFGPATASSKLLKWVTSFVADRGGSRGAPPPYNFPHQRVSYWDESLPVPTGPWRGLGASVNAFARESVMDELAQLAGNNPLQFRLDHLAGKKNKRLRNVLLAVAKLSGWKNPLPAGVGKGIACGIYKETTFVAVVAHIRLNAKTRQIQIEKLFCAHDCGKIINPDSVTAQVEGNLIWGAGMTLVENLRLKDGKMEVVNFHNYPLMRMSQAPDIEVILVQNPNDPPSGAGEPAIMPTPAAIANAISNVAGKRITDLPIKPEHVF